MTGTLNICQIKAESSTVLRLNPQISWASKNQHSMNNPFHFVNYDNFALEIHGKKTKNSPKERSPKRKPYLSRKYRVGLGSLVRTDRRTRYNQSPRRVGRKRYRLYSPRRARASLSSLSLSPPPAHEIGIVSPATKSSAAASPFRSRAIAIGRLREAFLHSASGVIDWGLVIRVLDWEMRSSFLGEGRGWMRVFLGLDGEGVIEKICLKEKKHHEFILIKK